MTEGMLAAYARPGFAELAGRLNGLDGQDSALDQRGRIVQAYVGFAVAHPAHFDVMFRIGLNKSKYPDLIESATRARDLLMKPATELTRTTDRWNDPEAPRYGSGPWPTDLPH